MQRREFLRQSALAAVAAQLPPQLLGDPYAPLRSLARRASVVRVRGRIMSDGRGIPGVAVSDGLSVVATERDGRFTLIADRSQPFVFMTAPAGYETPTSATGTAAFYRGISADARDEMQGADFSLARARRDDANHAFLVLADTQTQNAFEMGRLHAETVPDVAATIASLGDQPVFGVACGDIMYDDLTLYPEYERAVRGMGAPFYQVVGNHDLVFNVPGDEASVATFERHFGPAYYSFDRGEVHYVVLDDVFWHGRGYLGYVTEAQQRWLRADLAHVERGRTVVVFLHIPVFSTQEQRRGVQPGISISVTNRDALYRLLEGYDAYVLSGHTHEHERHRDGGVRHHVHGAVCGAWWSGDICHDGTPNGYAVYEARGRELRWRYKSTGQPVDYQMRLHAPGSDPTAPSDFVANIWDSDDRWKVTWFEDGQPRGLMSRRLGLDPRTVAEHTGPDKPARREWVEPMRTNHLYYAPVSPGAREIRVEATDPWGRTYSASQRLNP